MVWCGSGMSGEMARYRKLESAELRFCTACMPQLIQWLSGNGSAYRAYETIDFAIRQGLVPCFAPVPSPQSNDVSEACVKTFGRDYVYIHDCPDARTALARLPRGRGLQPEPSP